MNECSKHEFETLHHLQDVFVVFIGNMRCIFCNPRVKNQNLCLVQVLPIIGNFILENKSLLVYAWARLFEFVTLPLTILGGLQKISNHMVRLQGNVFVFPPIFNFWTSSWQKSVFSIKYFWRTFSCILYRQNSKYE